MSELADDLAFDLGGDGSVTIASTNATTVDHVAAGLARLPSQWDDAVHMRALLECFLARYNVVEAVIQDMLNKRSLETANADDPDGVVGAQLDQIGRKVGQPRNGFTNTDYRRYCRAKIRANNSNGRREDLIAVATLILNDVNAIVRIKTMQTNTAWVVVENVAVSETVATALADFLRVAVAAGIRLQLSTSSASPDDTFRFNSGPGFGSALTFPSGGGIFAGVQE